MNDFGKKYFVSNIGLMILLVITAVTAVLYANATSKMTSAYADIMNVESISSTTQRQISIASTDAPQEREVFVISDNTQKALSIDGEEKLFNQRAKRER